MKSIPITSFLQLKQVCTSESPCLYEKSTHAYESAEDKSRHHGTLLARSDYDSNHAEKEQGKDDGQVEDSKTGGHALRVVRVSRLIVLDNRNVLSKYLHHLVRQKVTNMEDKLATCNRLEECVLIVRAVRYLDWKNN